MNPCLERVDQQPGLSLTLRTASRGSLGMAGAELGFGLGGHWCLGGKGCSRRAAMLSKMAVHRAAALTGLGKPVFAACPASRFHVAELAPGSVHWGGGRLLAGSPPWLAACAIAPGTPLLGALGRAGPARGC